MENKRSTATQEPQQDTADPVTHYTLRFEDRSWEGASYWEETYLHGLSDADAIQVIKNRGNIAPGDVQRIYEDEHDLSVYRADGTIYLFRTGEDNHFFSE